MFEKFISNFFTAINENNVFQGYQPEQVQVMRSEFVSKITRILHDPSALRDVTDNSIVEPAPLN